MFWIILIILYAIGYSLYAAVVFSRAPNELDAIGVACFSFWKTLGLFRS